MTRHFPDHSSRRRSDADPMIDALLSEFLPSEPSRRSRPPDLSAQIIAKLASPIVDQTVDQGEHADADPLIDSLLREFLVSDSNRSSGPPDLSAVILKRLAETADSKRIEFAEDADPVVDTLLVEFVPVGSARQQQPPDMTEPILAELRGAVPSAVLPSASMTRGVAAEGVAAEGEAGVDRELEVAGRRSTASRWVPWLLAVAACLAGAVYLTRYSDDSLGIADAEQSLRAPGILDSGRTVGGDRSLVRPDGLTAPDQRLASAGVDRQPVMDAADDDSTDPIRGIPLAAPLIAKHDPDPSSNSVARTHAEEPKPQRIALAEVAVSTSQTVQEYWSALGITPTPEAETSEIAGRLANRLGITIPEVALTDVDQLQDVLSQASNADEIAKRWLAVTAGSPLGSVSRSENSGLIGELSSSIVGRSKLDTTLVSLIDGSNQHSAQWYATLGRGGTEGIAKRLAGMSINADIRCVRCHDSHIGRTGTQDDYWSFVALVRSVVARNDGRWTVAQQATPQTTFFELLDGRQSMAVPKVSGYLLQSSEKIEDFRTWTKTLTASDALAGSMVDSLWKIVHGRPLKPSPVDAFPPPFDEHLDRLHQQLADDLQANEFDVTRTLALIIASPMARRSVPMALRDDGILAGSESARAEALDLVYAFAAAVDTPPSSQSDRIELAMRRVGGRLNSDGQSMVLAQPIDGKPRNPNSLQQLDGKTPSLSFQERLSADFPSDDAPPPVSWLRLIDDFDLKIQHLVYLAGLDGVTPEITSAAEHLKTLGSEDSALSRLWWILRNQ